MSVRVGAALERRPNAAFDIVAVAPSGSDSARVALDTNRSRRNAENVLRTLTNMGLPADRMTLSATASPQARSEEHTSELQSLMRISYAVFCLKKKTPQHNHTK